MKKHEFLVFSEFGEVNTRLCLSKETFEQVKTALAPLGISFRSPSR
ncbi:MAG: hypothetical protein NWF06_10345 [Candidatus Bathyarchaeota archaeon]|nr:hypothetical protein [Candidatus Bathyarchaeum sp.]